MDSHLYSKFYLLMFVSAICFQIKAEGRDSVVFLDSPSHPYLRTASASSSFQNSISLSEVGAAVSVLLGLAPPASLPPDSSSKLDEVLLPNPFDRPRAVFMLEVRGVEDPSLFIEHPNFQVGGASSSKVLVESNKVDIELAAEDDVYLALLDKPDEIESDLNDKELHDFANWLGGSYVGTLNDLDGELTLPLASGAPLRLYMSKKADREFAISLASLVHNIRVAGEMHADFVGGMRNPAEILTGCFTGIQALRGHYGPGGAVEQGMDLFLTTLTKLFDSLQLAYRGQIVGVVLLNEKSSQNSGRMLDVKFSTQAPRWLEEVGPLAPTLKAVLLVRRTLAWITGLILLISTLIGIYLLFNMPLTRDTLLYSNVKLD